MTLETTRLKERVRARVCACVRTCLRPGAVFPSGSFPHSHGSSSFCGFLPGFADFLLIFLNVGNGRNGIKIARKIGGITMATISMCIKQWNDYTRTS